MLLAQKYIMLLSASAKLLIIFVKPSDCFFLKQCIRIKEVKTEYLSKKLITARKFVIDPSSKM